jgi:hypothetical protein
MKVVIVLDGELPLGLAANAAAALAFSVSPLLPECVGSAIADASGAAHPGITNIPLPVLATSSAGLAELRETVVRSAGVACIDFSDIAQRAKNYADYARALRVASPEAIRYLGLCVFGEDRAVRSLTGRLPLFGR